MESGTAGTTETRSSELQGRAFRRLDVIVKVADRCNLACTYCYFFRDKDSQALSEPTRMALDTWAELITFIEGGIRQHKIELVRLIFHGGEPTLIGQQAFESMCKHAVERLGEIATVQFSIQTNGTLLSRGWIRLFKKYQVAVGISLDGPPEYNDKARLDHQGRSSYAATRNGIQLLMDAADAKEISRPGALVVLNPEFDAKTLFEHLVNELGFRAFDVLLPDEMDVTDAAPHGRFLCDLFDAWVAHADDKIYIRTFRSLLDRFAGRGSYQFPLDPSKDDFLAISVSSGGSLRPDDVIVDSRMRNATIRNITFSDFAKHPLYIDWLAGGANVPAECATCCWSGLCRGGHPTHRFREDGRGFNRKSVYCEALKQMYAHVSAFMLNSGYPIETLVQQIGLDAERINREVVGA